MINVVDSRKLDNHEEVQSYLKYIENHFGFIKNFIASYINNVVEKVLQNSKR